MQRVAARVGGGETVPQQVRVCSRHHGWPSRRAAIAGTQQLAVVGRIVRDQSQRFGGPILVEQQIGQGADA